MCRLFGNELLYLTSAVRCDGFLLVITRAACYWDAAAMRHLFMVFICTIVGSTIIYAPFGI